MVPAKDEDTLCTQLQGKKLIRNSVKYMMEPINALSSYISCSITCRLCDLLGSGQFGTVYKGVLGNGEDGGEVEVAVKTLKEGSGEEDRVKFLHGGGSHHGTVQTP